MTEPTPGPWKARYNGSCWQIDDEHDAVATTQFCYAPAGEANARLIASAPELYEALEAMIFAHDTIQPMDFEKARAALAKARGEP
jgi:hypothetical protein